MMAIHLLRDGESFAKRESNPSSDKTKSAQWSYRSKWFESLGVKD